MATAQERFMAQAAKRRAQAVKLREKGKTLQEIGDKMGVSRQRVSQWLALESRK